MRDRHDERGRAQGRFARVVMGGEVGPQALGEAPVQLHLGVVGVAALGAGGGDPVAAAPRP
jgi:hypothetical protein